ncbi:CD99 antigen-like protein 2 isoform X3 [Brachyhypopomus gauderio]|uniref:CD99 antigen-like protein 2 isoform X3 n=1 Tax=Brachyhypopomus gauderio TaxID=698409 RepID=UPI004041CDF0
MRGLRLWTLLAVFSLVAVKGLGQDLNLSDALDDDLVPTPTPKTKPKEPAGGPGASKDLDLADMLDDEPTPKPPVLPKDPVKPKPKPGPDDFDLSDALEPNDIDGKGKDSGKGDKGMGGGGRGDSRPSTHDGNGNVFTDDDLLGVGEDDSYKPDKGKGGRGGAGDDLGPADDGDYDTMAETGTIAGIVSAVAMALVGAVSGYISYQKKKLCFSIQQSLNADVVKAENPEAVVAQEPQVQQTLLQPPNAEPPTDDNAV